MFWVLELKTGQKINTLTHPASENLYIIWRVYSIFSYGTNSECSRLTWACVLASLEFSASRQIRWCPCPGAEQEGAAPRGQQLRTRGHQRLRQGRSQRAAEEAHQRGPLHAVHEGLSQRAALRWEPSRVRVQCGNACLGPVPRFTPFWGGISRQCFLHLYAARELLFH